MTISYAVYLYVDAVNKFQEASLGFQLRVIEQNMDTKTGEIRNASGANNRYIIEQ